MSNVCATHARPMAATCPTSARRTRTPHDRARALSPSLPALPPCCRGTPPFAPISPARSLRSPARMSAPDYAPDCPSLSLSHAHTQILIDLRSAELVHIDLGIAFEAGKLLTTPETVQGA
eukprot:838548-Prymnesium_polylepis.2